MENTSSIESNSPPPATERATEGRGVVFVDGPAIANAKKRKRADVWDHFEVVFVEQGNPKKAIQKGKCKHCNALIAADSNKNGTSALRRHAERHGNAFGEPRAANAGRDLHGGNNACEKLVVKPKINGGRTILNYFRPDSVRLKL